MCAHLLAVDCIAKHADLHPRATDTGDENSRSKQRNKHNDTVNCAT